MEVLRNLLFQLLAAMRLQTITNREDARLTALIARSVANDITDQEAEELDGILKARDEHDRVSGQTSRTQASGPVRDLALLPAAVPILNNGQMGATEAAKALAQDQLAPMSFAAGMTSMFQEEGFQPDNRIVSALAMLVPVPLTALTTKAILAVREMRIEIKYHKTTTRSGDTARH